MIETKLTEEVLAEVRMRLRAAAAAVRDACEHQPLGHEAGPARLRVGMLSGAHPAPLTVVWGTLADAGAVPVSAEPARPSVLIASMLRRQCHGELMELVRALAARYVGLGVDVLVRVAPLLEGAGEVTLYAETIAVDVPPEEFRQHWADAGVFPGPGRLDFAAHLHLDCGPPHPRWAHMLESSVRP